MQDDVLPDGATRFGRRVRERLGTEQVIWLTSTSTDGTPQPNPVWFVWQDPSTLLVYNRPDAHRLAHIDARPRVAVHFDGNGSGGDIVVLTGRAMRAPDEPPPHARAAYLEKYRDAMTRVSGSPEAFSGAYPVPLRIEVDRVRGF
jgi:PPOX class probable F420-dependent enzyme